eukprot:11477586-Heterocapsa_arctica.AAC.1
MEIIAESNSNNKNRVDYSYTESISKMVGVYSLYTWRGWSQLSKCFKYLIFQRRHRKSTPRDLIAEPVARTLGGKGASVYLRSREIQLLSSR